MTAKRVTGDMGKERGADTFANKKQLIKNCLIALLD